MNQNFSPSDLPGNAPDPDHRRDGTSLIQPSASGCPGLEDTLKAYADNQLAWWQRRAVRRHLAACARCREEIEEMRRFSNRLRRADAGTLSPDLRARILAAVPETAPAATATGEAVAPRGKRRAQRPLVIWGAAASVTVLYFALYPAFKARQSLSDASMQSMPHLAQGTRQISTGGQMYVQDYDEARRSDLNGAPSGGATFKSPAAAKAASASGAAAQTDVAAAGEAQTRSSALPAASPVAAGRAERYAAKTDTYSQANMPVNRAASALNSSGGSFGFQTKAPSRRSAHALAKAAGRLQSSPSLLSAPSSLPESSDEEVTRKVHKTADITVVVDKVEQSSETVEQMTRTEGGYVANNTLSTGDDNTKSATLAIKIPVKRFEEFLTQIAHLGEVKGKNVTGEDITDRTSDEVQQERGLQDDIGMTQAKLKEPISKREQAESLETLRQLRVKAAQTKARLENLRKLGALADVTVNLAEKPRNVPPPPPGGFFSEMKNDMQSTLNDAMQSLAQAARLPLILLVWIIAYTPIWILLFLSYRYLTVWRRSSD